MRKDVFRDGETAHHEQGAAPQGESERQQVGTQEVRLHGQHGHRPHVLDHEHAQGDPSGQGIELVLVIQQLDDHERAGQAHAGCEVDQVEVAACVANSDCVKEGKTQADADWHLQRAGEQYGGPG